MDLWLEATGNILTKVMHFLLDVYVKFPAASQFFKHDMSHFPRIFPYATELCQLGIMSGNETSGNEHTTGGQILAYTEDA